MRKIFLDIEYWRDNAEVFPQYPFILEYAEITSMLSASLGTISAVERKIAVPEFGVVLVIGIATTCLTVLVLLISAYRPYAQSGSIRLVTSSLEQAYIGALEGSNLNPIKLREIRHER